MSEYKCPNCECRNVKQIKNKVLCTDCEQILTEDDELIELWDYKNAELS